MCNIVLQLYTSIFSELTALKNNLCGRKKLIFMPLGGCKLLFSSKLFQGIIKQRA